MESSCPELNTTPKAAPVRQRILSAKLVLGISTGDERFQQRVVAPVIYADNH